ncbi:hypothetical protein STEG23_011341 [Scotinomys teguina]
MKSWLYPLPMDSRDNLQSSLQVILNPKPLKQISTCSGLRLLRFLWRNPPPHEMIEGNTSPHSRTALFFQGQCLSDSGEEW